MTVTRRNLSSSHLVWHLLLIRSVDSRQSGFIGRNFLYSSASLWTISIVRKRERERWKISGSKIIWEQLLTLFCIGRNRMGDASLHTQSVMG
jgi:hypothetical protein